jgi:hypothetical protein
MSDGECNDGENELRQIMAEYPAVQLDTVAFGSGADSRKLQALADIAGGKMKTAADSRSLRTKFAEIASQLSHQPRNQENEAQRAKDRSMARECASVVDYIVPIVVRVLEKHNSLHFLLPILHAYAETILNSLNDTKQCMFGIESRLVFVVQDFFGLLRSSGSAEFVQHAMGGLSSGLQSSHVALQVSRSSACYPT